MLRENGKQGPAAMGGAAVSRRVTQTSQNPAVRCVHAEGFKARRCRQGLLDDEF